jgi:predicted Zn-dependent peptidase
MTVALPAPDGVHVTRLANGLTVISQAMAHMATVALGVWVPVGSRDEAPADHGIAHLIEHMAFKGTLTRSARDIAVTIENVGGDLNAATSVEQTCFTARVLAESLPLAVDLLADIVLRPRLDPEDLAREKQVIHQEIAAVEDAPDDLVFDRFLAIAFPDQPLGRPILGTHASLEAVTPDTIRLWLGRHYAMSDMVLAAVGALDHDALVALATEAFGDLHSAPSAPAPRAPAAYRGGDVRLRRKLEQAQIVLGWPGFPIRHKDQLPAQVFAVAMGGGVSSRLFQEIREDRGLAYAVDAFHWPFADTGLFGISAGTDEGDLGELVALVGKCLRDGLAGLDSDEIERARAQMRMSLLTALESPGARCEQLARQWQTYGRILSRAEIETRLAAIDLPAIRQAGATMLAGPVTLAAIGPLKGLPPTRELQALLAVG